MTTAIRAMTLVALLVPGVTWAASIDDKAGLFSKDALEKAEKKIADIRREFKRDVVIETFAEAKDVEKAKADKTGYYRNWARERYADHKVEGVYVLISKSPTWVQLAVGDRTRAVALDDARQKALRERFTTNFREKKFDDGLLSAVDYVHDVFATRVKSSAPAVAPTSASSGMPDWVMWVGVGLVSLLVIWVVIGLIRAFSGGMGGGGGFFSSLLGGMLGAAAGMYLYDSFFGSSSVSQTGDASSGMSDSTASVGDGGGWDDAGGSDFGGGDFGGDEW